MLKRVHPLLLGVLILFLVYGGGGLLAAETNIFVGYAFLALGCWMMGDIMHELHTYRKKHGPD